MFDDLIAIWEEVGAMLSDVAEHHTDMHPDDVAEVLRNRGLKAEELTRDILARRQYVQELTPYWKVTQSGADAGMPAAQPKTTQPLPIIKGQDIS